MRRSDDIYRVVEGLSCVDRDSAAVQLDTVLDCRVLVPSLNVFFVFVPGLSRSVGQRALTGMLCCAAVLLYLANRAWLGLASCLGCVLWPLAAAGRSADCKVCATVSLRTVCHCRRLQSNGAQRRLSLMCDNGELTLDVCFASLHNR